jgi:hypothetical protein
MNRFRHAEMLTEQILNSYENLRFFCFSTLTLLKRAVILALKNVNLYV